MRIQYLLNNTHVGQGDQPRGAKLTPADGTQLTPERGTRRYKPRARKCANKACQKSFTPAAKHGRYCSDACRKVDARKRKARTVKAEPAEPILVVCTCLYCNNTFFAEQGKGAKYCSDSHKELAYRQRRAATVEALVGDMNIPQQDAEDMLERIGMPRTRVYLRGRGYRYDEHSRRWGVPMERDVNVDVEQG